MSITDKAQEAALGEASAVYDVSALRLLVATLRECGVTHFDGAVPGWAPGRTVKLILGPDPAPAARNPEEQAAPAPRRPVPLTDDELDAAALRHVRIHGQPPKEI